MLNDAELGATKPRQIINPVKGAGHSVVLRNVLSLSARRPQIDLRG